jgi:hypothetical protein
MRSRALDGCLRLQQDSACACLQQSRQQGRPIRTRSDAGAELCLCCAGVRHDWPAWLDPRLCCCAVQEYAIAKLDDTELKKAFIRVKKPKEQMTESDRSRSRERQRDRDRRARKSRSAPRPHGRAGSRGGSCVGGHGRLAAVLACGLGPGLSSRSHRFRFVRVAQTRAAFRARGGRAVTGVGVGSRGRNGEAGALTALSLSSHSLVSLSAPPPHSPLCGSRSRSRSRSASRSDRRRGRGGGEEEEDRGRGKDERDGRGRKDDDA